MGHSGSSSRFPACGGAGGGGRGRWWRSWLESGGGFRHGALHPGAADDDESMAARRSGGATAAGRRGQAAGRQRRCSPCRGQASRISTTWSPPTTGGARVSRTWRGTWRRACSRWWRCEPWQRASRSWPSRTRMTASSRASRRRPTRKTTTKSWRRPQGERQPGQRPCGPQQGQPAGRCRPRRRCEGRATQCQTNSLDWHEATCAGARVAQRGRGPQSSAQHAQLVGPPAALCVKPHLSTTTCRRFDAAITAAPSLGNGAPVQARSWQGRGRRRLEALPGHTPPSTAPTGCTQEQRPRRNERRAHPNRASPRAGSCIGCHSPCCSGQFAMRWGVGGRFYGSGRRTSMVIATEILALEMMFYGAGAAVALVLGVTLSVPPSIWQLVDPTLMTFSTAQGTCSIVCTICGYVGATLALPSLVRRAKWVADFAFTVLVLHLALSSITGVSSAARRRGHSGAAAAPPSAALPDRGPRRAVARPPQAPTPPPPPAALRRRGSRPRGSGGFSTWSAPWPAAPSERGCAWPWRCETSICGATSTTERRRGRPWGWTTVTGPTVPPMPQQPPLPVAGAAGRPARR